MLCTHTPDPGDRKECKVGFQNTELSFCQSVGDDTGLRRMKLGDGRNDAAGLSMKKGSRKYNNEYLAYPLHLSQARVALIRALAPLLSAADMFDDGTLDCVVKTG